MSSDPTIRSHPAPQPSYEPRAGKRWLTVTAIALIAAFAMLQAGLAARTKAPTFDENLHAFSSWLIVNRGDFRVNPEHPPLWKYVAGLPLIGMPLPGVDLSAPQAGLLLVKLEQQWPWMTQSLYGTSGASRTDGLALVSRARVPMVLFLGALVLIAARWAWRWGGPTAGVIAAILVALEPNLIAHGGLVTNDVAASATFAAAIYLTWRLGEQFSARNVALLTLAIVAAVGVKFTSLLLAPMLGIPLLYRALASTPWPIGRADASSRRVASIGRRLGWVAGLAALIGAACIAGLWPMYRFAAMPTAEGQPFEVTYPRRILAMNAIYLEERDRAGGTFPQLPDEYLEHRLATFQPGLLTRGIYALGESGLLPQAYTFGIDYANARSLRRTTYLLGQTDDRGKPAYFPIALAVKTPLTLIAMVCASAIVGAVILVRRMRQGRFDATLRWKLVCLIVPPAIYMAAAMTSPLNIGVRHVLPTFVPAFVGIAVVASQLVRRWRPMRAIAPAAIVLLAIEVLPAFPNELSYFNLAVGGTRGGFHVLGDSNLDWGQDLAGLADWYHDWRRDNPNTPFYLAYFGTTDPRAYGIDYVNAGPGYLGNPTPPVDAIADGVFAVSATDLQGQTDAVWRPAMAKLRQQTPIATINDTIFIYKIDQMQLAATKPTTVP